jgi:hypothetical protein
MSWLSDIFGTTGIQNAAGVNTNMAQSNAGALTGAGQNTFAGITPTLNRWATGAAPGYGPANLSQMITGSTLATGAKTGAQAQDERLRALRTGNAAGINATSDMLNAGGARAAGSTLQDILSQNAMLKNKQQEMALGQLGKMGETQLQTGEGWGRQGAQDINAQLAGKQDTFNDLMGVLNYGAKVAGMIPGA